MGAGAEALEFREAAASPFALLDGGCSSPSRAPDCGSGGSGFETRQPPHLFIGSDLLFGGDLGFFSRHRRMPHRGHSRLLPAGGCSEVRFRGEKKEGAIHAPVMRVSGLGLMAFRGHLKHPVVLTCLHNVAK